MIDLILNSIFGVDILEIVLKCRNRDSCLKKKHLIFNIFFFQWEKKDISNGTNIIILDFN